MAIDLIRGGRIANRGFKPTKSSNSYLKTLIKVAHFLLSFTPSSIVEPHPSSTESSTKGLISPGLIDILSLYPGLSVLLHVILPNLFKEKINLIVVLLLLLDLSPMIIDCSISQKESGFAL